MTRAVIKPVSAVRKFAAAFSKEIQPAAKRPVLKPGASVCKTLPTPESLFAPAVTTLAGAVKKAPAGSVYIGRRETGMHYGNPATHIKTASAAVHVTGKLQAIEYHEEWLDGKHPDVEPARRAWVLENLEKLRGKVLFCPGGCEPGTCHGDNYIKRLHPPKPAGRAVLKVTPAVAKPVKVDPPPAKVTSLPRLSLPIVQPDADGKGGCMRCTMAAYAADFDQFALHYTKDRQKLVEKLHEPHVTQHRFLHYPYDPVDVLFVDDYPERISDRKGEPFTDGPGILLKRSVEDVFEGGIRVGYTYVFRCATPLNKKPSPAEALTCAPELYREIRARKPRIIVPLGNEAMKAVMGHGGGVVGVSGNVTYCNIEEFKHVHVVPCMSPGYVLVNNHEFERFGDILGVVSDLAVGKYKVLPGPGKVEVIEDLQRALQDRREDRRV
jgi:uracil-DNA glycosylase family 4